MSSISELIEIQNRLLRNTLKINNPLTQYYANISNNAFVAQREMINKSLSGITQIIEQQQAIIQSSVGNFQKIINQQQEVMLSISSTINNDLLINIQSISNIIKESFNTNNLVKPLLNTDKIIESLTNIYVSIDNAKNSPSDESEIIHTEQHDTIVETPDTNSLIESTPTKIDWKWLIPVIISLLGFLIQYCSYLDSKEYSEQDLKIKTEISESLKELNIYLNEEMMMNYTNN